MAVTRKVWIGIVSVSAAAVLGVWVRQPPTVAPPALAQVLSARHTAAVVTAEDLAALVQTAIAWSDLLPDRARAWVGPWLDAEGRRARLGFDPAVTDGWATIGVDARRGGALVIDSRVRAAAAVPVPVVVAAAAHESTLRTWFARITGASVGTPDARGLVPLSGPLGPATWASAPGWSAWAVVPMAQADGLAHLLTGAAPRLDSDPAFRAATSDLTGGARLVGYAASAALVDVVGPTLPALGGSTAAAAATHLARLFPAAAAWTGSAGVGARIVAGGDGQTALRQLFVPDGPLPSFARHVPRRGWAALRATLSVAHAFEGAIGLIPPEAATARLAVAGARSALSWTGGPSWEDLVRAVPGHAVVAIRYEGLILPGTQAIADLQWAVLASVKDATATDLLVMKLTAAARKVLGDAVVSVPVAGAAGWGVRLGPLRGVLVRVGDLLVFASDAATAERLLQLPEGDSLAGTPVAAALDGNVVVGWALDLGAAARMVQAVALLDDPGRAERLRLLRHLAKVAPPEAPWVGADIAVDDRGLTLHTRGEAAGAALAVVPLAAWLAAVW
ncbi:MAG: hypothetical protein EXR79_05560 [Myxococcales bacterium]|nr:hypothetical protein [Myxococcales bacterium]